MRLSGPHILFLGFVIAVAWKAYSYLSTFRRNLKLARSTGLPYVFSPIHPWRISTRIFVPLLRVIVSFLPAFLQRSRLLRFLDHIGMDPIVMNRYGELYPDDGKSYVIVSPSSVNVLVTRDAELVNQMYARRNEFDKPLDDYSVLALFGNNLITVEGEEWKRHRKVVGATFNDKNNSLVWSETIDLAERMLHDWTEKTKKNLPIATLNADIERLALYVISAVGFGIKVPWTAKTESTKSDDQKHVWRRPHKMTFPTCMSMLSIGIIPILFFPHWIMQLAPSKTLLNRIYHGFVEMKGYILDILDIEKEKMDMKIKPGADLVSNIIRGTHNGVHLSSSEILGNAYVMILAGQESTAHTMEYAIIKLAQNPRLVAEFQQAVQARFGSKPFSEWNYPEDFDGFAEVAALMYETLRLYPASPFIPKRVGATLPARRVTTSEKDGRDAMLPPGTKIQVDLVGIHRSFEHWGPDAHVFRPSRWIVKDLPQAHAEAIPKGVEPSDETEDGDQYLLTLNPRVIKPPKGHFMPFSEGNRACIGRKFAMVEFAAVLAVLFLNHGVELDSSSDDTAQKLIFEDEVKRLGEVEATKRAYQRRSDSVEDMLNKSTSVITLKPPENVALRWVPKGQEVWRKWIN